MTGDDLKELLSKYPVTSGCLLLCVIMLAWLVMRTDPIPGYQKQIADANRKIQVMDQNKMQSQTLSADVARLDRVVDNINGRLMSAANTTKNLSYFFRFEEETNTTIDDPVQLDPQPLSDPMVVQAFNERLSINPVHIVYKLDITGMFPDVLSYLSFLTTGDYFTRIDGFKMKPLNNGDSIVLTTSFVVLGKEK